MKRLAPFVLVAALACGSAIGAAKRTVNATAAAGTVAAQAIGAADLEAQQRAVEAATSEEEARAEVAAIRARFGPVWAAYQRYRAVWIAAAAAVRAAEAADAVGQQYDEAAIVRLLAELGAAQAALNEALAKLR